MKHLTEKDRFYIEKSLKAKKTVRQIAAELGFSTVTIYAEIKKGTVTQMDKLLRPVRVYAADAGQRLHDQAMIRTGRKHKLLQSDPFLQEVRHWIVDMKYSPEAALYVVSEKKVCVKTLYNYIHANYISGLNTMSLPYATSRKKLKKKIPKRLYSGSKKSIEDRPKEINHRNIFGHWEMDTVYSSRDDLSCLLVLTERMTRQELVFQLPDRTNKSVVSALDRLERQVGSPAFRDTFRSITCDNGVEFSDGSLIERSCRNKRSRTTVYFCHPYCSSERGSNENANKFIRRWIPKGDDIGLYTQIEIKKIQDWINNYPRKLFNGLSCNQVLSLMSPVGDGTGDN